MQISRYIEESYPLKMLKVLLRRSPYQKAESREYCPDSKTTFRTLPVKFDIDVYSYINPWRVRVIFLRGNVGDGKSTAAKLLKGILKSRYDLQARILSTDSIRLWILRIVPPWVITDGVPHQKSIGEYEKAVMGALSRVLMRELICFETAINFLHGRISIVDTTLYDQRQLDGYIESISTYLHLLIADKSEGGGLEDRLGSAKEFLNYNIGRLFAEVDDSLAKQYIEKTELKERLVELLLKKVQKARSSGEKYMGGTRDALTELEKFFAVIQLKKPDGKAYVEINRRYSQLQKVKGSDGTLGILKQITVAKGEVRERFQQQFGIHLSRPLQAPLFCYIRNDSNIEQLNEKINTLFTQRS